MQSSDWLYYLLLLNSVKYLGPRRIRRLVNLAGTPEAVFNLSSKHLQQIPGFNVEIASAILKHARKEFAEEQLKRLSDSPFKLIHLWHEEYPRYLKEIADPPPLLWIHGNLSCLNHKSPMVIVGTRRATHYGRTQTEKIVTQLVRNNFPVISGLARGIDSIAHRTAVHNKGKTCAVIANGLDIVYPPENKTLSGEIAENGAILSEFPLGTRPEPSFFFRRNRIIAGLGKAIIVIEAGQKSGALITASFAIEYNRDVYALPGPVSAAASTGCNKLIQQGAFLLMDPDELIAEYSDSMHKTAFQQRLSLLNEEEELILQHLTDNPIHVDQLVMETGLPLSTLNSLLLNLELEGYVLQLSGGMYIKN